MSKFTRLFQFANAARLATYLIALWKLFKHPQTPRAAKLVAIAVIAYAVSPIDLIPDFIPVLGQLDELILLPLGVALAVKLTPPPLWEARLREAEASAENLPRLWWGALLILLVWAAMFGLFVWWLLRLFASA
ncbi:YkvA family protein [uncultured Piscinibacter sp.]|uniref:YkvA family protein n=1 Tax=uncultured Piscinibacter sp. TaxID=1131835 RepID=UPI002604146D|nr:YkvA family protein [uncultured Piscinibacter sp.]